MTFKSKAQISEGINEQLSRVIDTIENEKSTGEDLNQAEYEFMSIREKISELSKAYDGNDDWLYQVNCITKRVEDLFTKTFSHRYIF
ncbi:MAG: hypothetical protein Q8N35_16045 [Methylococcaceae bacterium]|nr:hypothetical protein [Methylococcaceae bacterium]MDZ4157305.1 hypothetical protein [Methylococcales bacterium]MDP2392594.1 hypothetical protein [Methylococcaceae bacterium]MDP3021094.1 hypothetical protein [Methylococcaceae bacterium]MDP3388481.1 hypothetical protein [Methylococcaceae bacterium]